MKNQIYTIIFLFVVSQSAIAQNPFQALTSNDANKDGAQIAKATEFTIPSSPAFDLLNVNPAQVTRPSNIRDFKVDWSFRSWRLKPNIALQAQPVWELFYNRADLKKYRNASAFSRLLSTLDISAGTVEDDDQSRRASLSAKLNLYHQKDPLLDKKLFLAIDTNYRKMQVERLNSLHTLQNQMKKQKSKEAKFTIEHKIDSLENYYEKLAAEQKVKIQEIAQQFVKDNWNTSHIDLAYGKVFRYKNDSLSNLQSTGLADAIWLNASTGIGKKILLTGLVRYTIAREIKEFKDTSFLKNDIVETTKKPIEGTKDGNILSAGISFRYGSPKFNFFVEYVGSFQVGKSDALIGSKQSNLTQLAFHSISYGGDWRINRNITLTYGARTDFSQTGKFQNLIPVAGLACMMR